MCKCSRNVCTCAICDRCHTIWHFLPSVPGGEEIPLVFRDGCTYAPIRKPTQKELDKLPWIMLTVETGWQDLMDTETKEEEFDLDNPTWFTPTTDDELETKDWQPAFW